MKKCLIRILCLLLTVGLLALPAGAAQTIDMTKTGTLSMELRYGGEPVTGGVFTVYPVAEIREQDWNYSFCYLDSFRDMTLPLDDLRDPGLIPGLEAYIQAHDPAGIQVRPDDRGCWSLTDLELGLYLVVQTEAAPGYYPVGSFLISLPARDEGAYRYEVDASPKLDVPGPEPSDPPPTEPTEPPEPELPYTGQLMWPIPLMSICGALLFLVGWWLCAGGERKRHER